jgi:hypothetical protein
MYLFTNTNNQFGLNFDRFGGEQGYGPSPSYGQNTYGQQYGRSLMSTGLNKMTEFAWRAIDKFSEYNEIGLDAEENKA